MQFTAPRLAVWLALACMLPAVHPAALAQVDTSRRQALESQIGEYQELLESRRQETQRIEEALGETNAVLRQRIAERDRLSSELAELRSEREELQGQIHALESQLDQTQVRIDSVLADIDALKVRLRALLVNLHRQRSGRFARVLSQAESFHDLQVKNYYLSLLNEQDANVLNSLATAREDLLAAQLQLSQELAELENAEAQLRRNQAELEGKQAELASVIADLESTQAGQLAQQQALIEAQSELEQALGDLDRQLDEEIERLRQEQARLEREARQAYLEERERQRLRDEAADVGQRIENLTAPITAAPSGYIYPVAGHTIISEYGEDNNSYMAMRAAADNAAVLAVQEGVVRAVSFVSANDGYMVSIAHSQRLSTVYTNLRPPQVQVGDRVAQGQVIGHLGGSTLVAPDTLKLWVQVTDGGVLSFVDPAAALGF